MAIGVPQPNPLLPIIGAALAAILALLSLKYVPSGADDEIDQFLADSASVLSRSDSELPAPPRGMALQLLTPQLKDVAALKERLGRTSFEAEMKRRAPKPVNSSASELLSRILQDPSLQTIQLATLNVNAFRPESGEKQPLICDGASVVCRRVLVTSEKDDGGGMRRIMADLAVTPKEPNGSVLLMERTMAGGRSVIGSVRVGPEAFLLRQASQRLFVLTTQRKTRLDRYPDDMPKAGTPPAGPPPSAKLEAPKAAQAATDTVFRSGLDVCPNPRDKLDVEVLVGVTKRANAEIPNAGHLLTRLIDLAWGEANTSFTKSDINANMLKPHVTVIDYVETGGRHFNADIQEILKPSGRLMSFRKARADLKADFAVLLVHDQDDSNCGRAAERRVGKDMAYAIVNWKCVANLRLSFIHELGHLVGIWHDPASLLTGEIPTPAYAQGYITTSSPTGSPPVATIMANVSTCTPCGHDSVWSNPDKKTVDGRVLGTLDKNFDACVWRQRLPEVSAFDGG